MNTNVIGTTVHTGGGLTKFRDTLGARTPPPDGCCGTHCGRSGGCSGGGRWGWVHQGWLRAPWGHQGGDQINDSDTLGARFPPYGCCGAHCGRNGSRLQAPWGHQSKDQINDSDTLGARFPPYGCCGTHCGRSGSRCGRPGGTKAGTR